MSSVVGVILVLGVLCLATFFFFGGSAILSDSRDKKVLRETRSERKARIKREDEIHQIEMEERRAEIRREEDERLNKMIKDIKDGKE